MKQLEKSISKVMSILKDEQYSPSVISLHRLCYQEITEYILVNKLSYLPDVGCKWIETHRDSWSYRKYTGYRHCINQLNDVFQTGNILTEHFYYRFPAYDFLSDEYRAIIDKYITDMNYTFNVYRISCSRFLLYMQNNNICHISDITYESIIAFHKEDIHRSLISKDRYEDVIRNFLRYLATNSLCDIGLSLTLNKLLINKIIFIPEDELEIFFDYADDSFEISWMQITDFVSKLKKLEYGKSVVNCSIHILTLLYIFQQTHKIKLNKDLIWFWFEFDYSIWGSVYKQYRRTLFQFLEYINTGIVVTKVTGDPKKYNQ